MKRLIIFSFALLLFTQQMQAQSNRVALTLPDSIQPNYKVKQALEIESLAPMFFTGGYHIGLCYRYERFRFRISVINGGTYDAEPAGLTNSSSDFKRYYKTSPGFFLGYNLWRNLELYSYLEFHTFGIEQKSSGTEKRLHSTDVGAGLSYQFFIGRRFYIQPGIHIYLRGDHQTNFNGEKYSIPNVDVAPVIRIGYRYWSRF